MSAANDAELALLAMYAEDAYIAGQLVTHPFPPLLSTRWSIAGYVTGVDALFRTGPLQLLEQRVFYGWVLRSFAVPATFACVVRGTAGLVEWLEDAEFAQRPHPLGGKVEDGFYGLFQALRYRVTPSSEDQPLVTALSQLVGANPITVIGHSLGAALATYLTLDLAVAGSVVTGRFFASPRPGNSAFSRLFDQHVSRYRGWAYTLDVVPRVPFGLDYAPLCSTMSLDQSEFLHIRCNLKCNHHAASYAGLLDAASIADIDPEYRSCVIPVGAHT